MIKSIISVVLIILLLVCLFDMPYGYYQLVRVIAFVGFGFLSFEEKTNHQNKIFLIIFLIAALTFNPIFKLYLGKTLWQVTDIFLSLILISYIIRK